MTKTTLLPSEIIEEALTRLKQERMKIDIPNWKGVTIMEIEEFLPKIKEAEASLIPRWIPVEERLPEVKERYFGEIDLSSTENFMLTIDKNGFVTTSIFYRANGWDNEGITHWMPIPQPPFNNK